MIKKLSFGVSFLIFVFSAWSCFADITSINVGSASITILGSNFGENPLHIVHLEDNIESGVANEEISLPPGWGADATSTSRKRPVYSTEYSHSGAKSIKASTPVQTQYTSGFWYTKPDYYQKAYVSWWVRARGFGFRSEEYISGQWKVFRITPGLAGGSYADQPHNWYWSQQFQNGSLSMEDGNNMFTNFCSSNETPTYDTSCFSGNATGGSGGIYRTNGLYTDVWQRVEVWVEQSSVSTQDGSIYVTIQKEGSLPVEFTNFMKDTCTRQSDQYPWRDIVWENYLGNGIDFGDIYIDDVFVQFDTRARVEIGNNSTFADCTHREIQPATAWSPTSITATLNQGSMPDGPAYLFVIDENGIASDGHPITLGGETPAYDIPTITIQDASTSTSSGTITGAYTVDSELSAGLCTWSHSSGSVTGFATSLLGFVSGTVTGLPVGETTVSFSLLDSESQEATDTAVFTRTESTHHSIGKGFYIKGINIK